MENFKKVFNKIFLYNESKNCYEFSLSPEQLPNNKENNISNNFKINTNLNFNLDYFKVKFNSLINSDIVIREFSLLAKGKPYKACLIFIDGMINSNIINNFVLRPLMENDKSCLKPKPLPTSNIIGIKKFNLENYIYNFLVQQNSIKKINTFNELISSINTGECVLLVDTLGMRIYLGCKRL